MTIIIALLALAAAIIAVWSQIRQTAPAVLWISVLLLSIAVLLPVAASLFGGGTYGHP